jgi:Holliday junction DNA helicase RuvA
MYEYISGAVTELAPTYAVVEACGLGYYINISLQTYSAIEGQEKVKLFLHFAVREDAQIFYGFATKMERELFRMLIGVSGVGGNTARMILSTYSTSELRNIIATENAVLLKNVKGLGLKTAQKIIVELSGKMLELGSSDDMPKVLSVQNSAVWDEAVSALMMLGFQKAASDKVVKSVLSEMPSAQVEEIIRQSLRRL